MQIKYIDYHRKGPKMKMTRIYTGSDGESHFEDLGKIQFKVEDDIGKLSEIIKVNNVRIHQYGPDLNEDWHNPRWGHTYVIFLEGEQEIEASDGTKRVFSYGDILLVEDLTGRGHRTRAKSETGGMSVILT